ncbi:FMN-dependent NADH-azoreductase [Sphingobacterium allocomposti]|uniref:FMN dependent NADH:quinone oxidoreductase n=1 Tax=Sphingobacterium allocomposti TaxID=415956 RepID=A0A5S5DA79_9SPHI|nr:NAD(P)H-dependent oxidoreductase [Sphingobacterium composti Yoo et al. 2007 non Ten et al. 2007]TYP92434.1 FMN-dependent NADH-azoreductase [Sphingobacterium composti Yoo et al. 2007 non Ten et al. 2007]
MQILHVVTSINGNQSMSHKLGEAIVRRLQEQADADILVRNLADSPLPHLDGQLLRAFFTPADQRPAQMAETVKLSEEAVRELFQADSIVIDVPMYNFSIPSTLKAWIDHIARAGVTFRYTENGPEGLVKGKKIYLAISSGGVYSEGALQDFDFTERYLRSVLGFMGMTDITAFRVEGVSLPDLREVAWPKALQTVEAFAF